MGRILDVNFWERFWRTAAETVTTRGIRILTILVVYVLARRLFNRLISGMIARIGAKEVVGNSSGVERANRLRTLQGMFLRIADAVLFFVLVIMLLDAMSVNVSGIITTAGISGLAFGFGAQKLVRDVISGLFLILEDQFAVGDYVTIGTTTGVVEELGLRITRLRDDQGRLCILANGDIVSVVNFSRAPLESFIEVGIGIAGDLEKAKGVIAEASDALFRAEGLHLLAVPQFLGVAAYDAAKITLRVSVTAPPRLLPAEQLRVREALYRAFLSAEIPLA